MSRAVADRPSGPRGLARAGEYATALLLVGAAGLAAKGLQLRFALPDPALVFLAAVLLAAVLCGLGPSITAAVASLLAYDFFFVEPIYTFTVVRHPLHPGLTDVVPYVSGVIDLDGTQGAGARLIVNIVDCDPETVAVGDKVRIRFDKVSDTYAVPRFVLLDA